MGSKKGNVKNEIESGCSREVVPKIKGMEYFGLCKEPSGKRQEGCSLHSPTPRFFHSLLSFIKGCLHTLIGD